MTQTDKAQQETATACQKTPTQTQSEGARILPDAPDFPQTRNYDDTMVEDLAKTHAQTLVKLDKARDHADKLAEALRAAQAWLIACSDKDYTYARQAIAIKASEALAAYEEGK